MTASSLVRLLEQRRPALEALPGVIGTAIGARDEAGSAEAIHVYVSRDVNPARVRSESERLLGVPVEVIEIDMPAAQSD
jgi:hypothetical protein